jgi:hypothetical protein
MKLLVAILLTVVTITRAYGAEPDIIGSVTELDGIGQIKRENETVGNSTGTTIQQMDEASTKKGKMRIDFVDETRLDVVDHSKIVIDEFVYDPATGKGSLDIRASLGAVRYASGQIAKTSRQKVRLRTPTATISVRGTDFSMVVNEIGESYVTLLPSCDTDGNCLTGEIKVENDGGYVIMNQAFQMTRVESYDQRPTKPVVVDLTEPQITGMLIFRRVDPIDEMNMKMLLEARREAGILEYDFLEFDDLEEDALVDSIKDIWVTEIDRGADYYLREQLLNMIDELNKALLKSLQDELSVQNEEFFADRKLGYDEDTGIFIDFEDPMWHIRRQDISISNTLDLYLNGNYGYKINIEQGDEAVYDYMLGVGNNNISIKQRQ